MKTLLTSLTLAALLVMPSVHAATYNYHITSTTKHQNNATMRVPSIKGAHASAVNKQIKAFNEQQYKAFTKDFGKAKHASYHFDYSLLAQTKKYVSLKVTATTTAADSAAVSKYYTFDRATGRQATLSSLFKKGTNYKKAINTALRKKAKGTTFKSINDQTSFYMNKKNQLVVAFDEGVIAPYSKGAITYTLNVKGLR